MLFLTFFETGLTTGSNDCPVPHYEEQDGLKVNEIDLLLFIKCWHYGNGQYPAGVCFFK